MLFAQSKYDGRANVLTQNVSRYIGASVVTTAVTYPSRDIIIEKIINTANVFGVDESLAVWCQTLRFHPKL